MHHGIASRERVRGNLIRQTAEDAITERNGGLALPFLPGQRADLHAALQRDRRDPRADEARGARDEDPQSGPSESRGSSSGVSRLSGIFGEFAMSSTIA